MNPNGTEAEVRYELSQDEAFQGKVLILTLAKCHGYMNNQEGADPKLLAKAHDIITNPESYKEKLALSVAALMDVTVGGNFAWSDSYITKIILDAFDALAGVGM